MFRQCLFSITISPSFVRTPFNFIKRSFLDLSYYEPPYLDMLKPKFPYYEVLTVQIKGYDYPVLENVQKFAHNIANFMSINVDSCWAHPAKHLEVHKFKMNSNITESTYKVLVYERNLKITNVDIRLLPVFIETVHAALPEGTTLKVFRFDADHESEKYVPDHELNAKLKELDELGGPPVLE